MRYVGSKYLFRLTSTNLDLKSRNHVSYARSRGERPKYDHVIGRDSHPLINWSTQISDRRDWSKRLRVLIEPSNLCKVWGLRSYAIAAVETRAQVLVARSSRVARDLDLALALWRAPWRDLRH